MRRLVVGFVLAGAMFVAPASAFAALLPPRSTTVTGTLTTTGSYMFTIQTPGKPVGVLNALTGAANRLGSDDFPYVWGGGHGQAGVSSVGARGPGFNGRRRGFDCSGAVAAVLVGGGLWPAGAGVPNDAGVIQYLLRRRLIAPGAGTGPREVTLYDHPGVHIFMNINGRFFGTSDGGSGANAKGGAGWLDDGAPDVTKRFFRRYHFVASAVKAKTSAGYTEAFQYGPGLTPLPSYALEPGVGPLSGYPVGTKLTVVFKTTNAGTMVAQSVTAAGQTSVTGTVQALAPDDSSFTVATSTGQVVTFPLAAGSQLAGELANGQIAAGDTVSVTYVGTPPATLTVTSVTVTSAPTTPTTPTSSPPSPPSQTSGG